MIEAHSNNRYGPVVLVFVGGSAAILDNLTMNLDYLLQLWGFVCCSVS